MLSKKRAIQQAVDSLPKVAKALTPWIPKFISEKVIEQSLNLFFKQDLQAGKLDFMLGKTVRIHVTDIHLEFFVQGLVKQHQLYLQVTQEKNTHAARARASQDAAKHDVSMAGSMNDLYLLMTQFVDPDTLFFRRRLQLRGDTELGLELKNFLDTVDLSERLPKKAHQLSLEIAEQIGFE